LKHSVTAEILGNPAVFPNAFLSFPNKILLLFSSAPFINQELPDVRSSETVGVAGEASSSLVVGEDDFRLELLREVAYARLSLLCPKEAEGYVRTVHASDTDRYVCVQLDCGTPCI
jgi:hypothetical protein